jgi:tetratricopeptide (TPR) repeat protein
MTATATPAANSNVPDSPATRALREGLDHVTAGRIGDAIATFKRGLADAEADAKIVAELHLKLGNAGMTLGDLDLAAENYSAALRLQPEMTPCWCNLGNVYLKWDRARDAVALYMQALSLDPLHWPSRSNLAQALTATRQTNVAKLLLLELNAERPQDGQICHQLGKLHAEDDELNAALDCFRRSIALRPDDADSFYGIGNVLQKMGDRPGAEAAFLHAVRLQPLIRRPATRSPAAFRVLALFAPFAGNTPTEYLLAGPAYDVNTLAVFEGQHTDVDMLRRNTDVVFNLISDADQAQALFPTVADLIDRLRLPTLNPPQKIQPTTREAITRRLKDIPGCRLPKVLRLPANISSITALEAAAAFAMPVLARPAGTHGGDDFEKFGNLSQVASFVARHPGVEHYLIEYLDYRSADGHFRKYRFIFIGGEILPYHLAIGASWKLHHDNTDMVDHPWMQREEEDFLGDPWAVFSPAHHDALRAIRNTVDLDYFGIDCALDAAGQIVVFEVNASMLVHQHNEKFPYKAPHVERIRTAFDAMLHKMATVGCG